MIVIGSSSVFTDDVFIYLHLFALTYISPTQYVIYREYHVYTKNYMAWNLPLVMCYVNHTTKVAAARITIHGSASSTYISCRLYMRTRFPSSWCIISMIVLDCGLPRETGLVLIKYSFPIKLFLNLWPRNYTPRSYMISTGHGYRTSHVVSTKFSFAISFFFVCCVTSNHPVMGSIIVTGFKIKIYFPSLRVWYGPMISTPNYSMVFLLIS